MSASSCSSSGKLVSSSSALRFGVRLSSSQSWSVGPVSPLIASAVPFRSIDEAAGLDRVAHQHRAHGVRAGLERLARA